MSKRGKEYKLQLNDNFKIKYGTVDKDNKNSLYLKLSSWAEPKNVNEYNYSRIISKLDKSIKQEVYNYLTSNDINFLSNRTILDLDMRESGVKYGKRSFINVELTLFNKINKDVRLNETDIKKICQLCIDNINSSNYFTFHKLKK